MKILKYKIQVNIMMCILKVMHYFYQLDPAKFLSAPKLAWQGAFKMAEVKL